MSHAALLQQENELLKQQLLEAEKVLQKKEAQLTDKNHYIVRLEELIKQFQRKQYSPSSEKASPNQHDLFNEAETIELESTTAEPYCDETLKIKPHRRTKKPRVSIPADWPREEVVYDLSAEQKICPHDGSALNEIGSEDHEQLELIPAQIKVIKQVRKKYACPCCKTYIAVADKPKQPIKKSIASPALLAYIAVNKYCDALPLYRQSEIFKRIGIELDRTNLANWMIKCGELIQPLINLLLEHLLEQPVIHMDETPVQVLNEPGKTAQSKSYMWSLAATGTQSVRLFHYAPTRSQSVPRNLLTTNVNAIMVDGYEGYQAACDQYAIQRLGCWAHARRKFVEAQKLQPKNKTGKANQAIAFIQRLYRIEQKIKDRPPDERYRIRQQQSKPIVNELKSWLDKCLPKIPPKTALGNALQYMQHQWSRLISYLDDGCYPIDNNAAENAIRLSISKKDWKTMAIIQYDPLNSFH